MSLTDTAEYWDDVKRSRRVCHTDFYHHPTYKCSHICERSGNTRKTPYIDDINCHECKEFIATNGFEGLLPGKGPPDFYMTKRAGKRWRQIHKYGLCSCGGTWFDRINSQTGVHFLGCSHYPRCKQTKSL